MFHHGIVGVLLGNAIGGASEGSSVPVLDLGSLTVQPEMWLMASENVVTTGSDVDSWTNKQNGSDILVPPGTKPVFVENAFGSLPGIRFAGSDQLRIAAVSSAIPRNKSAFHMFGVATGNKAICAYDSVSGSNRGLFLFLNDSSSTADFNAASQGSGTVDSTASDIIDGYTTGDVVLVEGSVLTSRVGSEVRAYANGASTPGVSNLDNIPLDGGDDGFTVAAERKTVNDFIGDIAEIITFGNELGTPDRDIVLDYLLSKYGLTQQA